MLFDPGMVNAILFTYSLTYYITMLKKVLQCAFVSFLTLTALTACQMPEKTKHTTLQQVPTNVKTHSSSYIYLMPIPKAQRTVYITTQNDSGEEDATNVKKWIAQSLQQKSFVVVDNLDQANLAVRINTLRLGKVSNDMIAPLLASEFGNSTPLISMSQTPDAKQPPAKNTALILDLQYFERKKLIDPTQVTARHSMADLSDLQFLLLCNTTRWERFQTRIVSIVLENMSSQEQLLNTLNASAAKTNADIVRGLSN